jgi:hypothetical protein
LIKADNYKSIIDNSHRRNITFKHGKSKGEIKRDES